MCKQKTEPFLTPKTLHPTGHPPPGASALSSMVHEGSTVGNAKLIQCSTGVLERLRRLNEAEIITLFTPIVPHPPSTSLAKDMDPFEPLGRALPRKVRHVPYRLDCGKTEMHTDFLPSCGAVIVVICATSNVLRFHAQALETQLQFARGIAREAKESDPTVSIPLAVFLVTDDATRNAYVNAACDLPALVTINDYTAVALKNAVRLLFGL